MAEASGLSRVAPAERDAGRRHLRRDRRGDPRRARRRRDLHRPRDRRERHDRRRRGTAARPRRRLPTATRRAPTWPASIRGWPASTSPSPATSRTRCSGRPARRPSTARRRARPPSDVVELDRPPRVLRRQPSRRAPVGGSATPRVPAPPAASASACWRSPDRFRSFALRPGVELLMEATGVRRAARREPTWSSPARAGSTRRRRSARRRSAWPGGQRRPASRASPSAAASTRKGSRRSPPSARSRSRSTERPQSVEAAMAAGTAPVERCGERIARLASIWLT